MLETVRQSLIKCWTCQRSASWRFLTHTCQGKSERDKKEMINNKWERETDEDRIAGREGRVSPRKVDCRTSRVTWKRDSDFASEDDKREVRYADWQLNLPLILRYNRSIPYICPLSIVAIDELSFSPRRVRSIIAQSQGETLG